jgi:hypothetical protein
MPKRLLWLCTHRTQWREEVPLLLDAGFEVIPAAKSHHHYPIDENPVDPYYVQDWRKTCTLPANVIDRLRAVNWFHEPPEAVIPLARKVLDGVIITSFLDTVLLFARWFPKPIFYRVFGRGVDPCYTERYGLAMVRELGETPAYRRRLYHWCPILPTLMQPEHEILTQNEVLLEPFVSLDRLPARWDPKESEPHVAVVLSRIADLEYFGNIYRQITASFCNGGERLRLLILGQNQPRGGPFNDPQIVGTLPDAEYLTRLARSRVFFYQGESILHLHWSVWEAFGMGVPVVMLHSGYPAWALRQIVAPRKSDFKSNPEYGIVQDFDDARRLLTRCLEDKSVAAAIARRQQPLVTYITDRNCAVRQYRERLEEKLGREFRGLRGFRRLLQKAFARREKTAK